MRDKFSRILNRVKDFWLKFFDKFTSDRKFRIITVSIVAAVLILAIIIAVIAANSGKKNTSVTETPSVLTDVTPTAVPTSSPTPAPTATPTPIPEPTTEPSPTPTPEPTPTPNLHIGELRSRLSGEWVSEETALSRPFAIMFNNIDIANPQSGIGEAKVLYEALVEGQITRLMGLVEGLNEDSSCASRIGSLRSARHYYASVADEYDAIYVHFGGTWYADDKIAELNLDDLNCMTGYGVSMYYRDKDIPAPHNAFATVERLNKAAKSSGYRLTYKDGYVSNHYNILENSIYPKNGNPVYDTAGNKIVYDKAPSRSASTIMLPYSSYMSPYLLYNPETGLYTRYQFNDVHIDYNTNEPLTFTNIIIQIVNEWNKDKNGYQDMELEDAEGTGYYISMGQCVPITWKKNEASRFMMYYTADGEVLNVNPGKTFISLFPNFREDKLVIE